jgi:signal transduction histidine kinase
LRVRWWRVSIPGRTDGRGSPAAALALAGAGVLLACALGAAFARGLVNALVLVVSASLLLAASALQVTLVVLRSAGARQHRLLARARRRREEAVRMLRSRDDFLAVAGHELKTPLTALRLQLEGLARAVRQRRPGFEALADERLARSLDHLERLQSLVTTMLDASGLTGVRLELDREPLDFSDVVGSVVKRLEEPAARVGSPIRLAHDGPLPGEFDRLRLEQLATHLVSNAVKFGMGQPVEVELRRDGAAARLSVRDQGAGIPRDAEGRLFERYAFGATANHRGGFGLGLWMVRRIVDSAGGTVEVESSPGAGATFTVRVPLVPGPGARS